MRKKFLLVFAAILVFSVGISAMLLNSNYHYSKSLISAIGEENITAVRQILKEKPSCVNTVPTLIPECFYTFADIPRPIYPLGEACYSGNIEIINVLLDHGADVNGSEGVIPLSVVYFNKADNWYGISQLLIKNGASIDYITKYSGGKSSVLQDITQVRSGTVSASSKPDDKNVIEAFEYALENCDRKNVDWMRVLQYSISNGRIEIVKLLLEQGYCDVNDTSVGITALMFASRDSTPEMVQLLLDRGADKSYRTFDGKTAYDYAVQSNNKDIIGMLKD